MEEDLNKLTEELNTKQEVKDLKDDLAQKARDNPLFANPKIAYDWTVDEVLHWIYTLEIGNDYINTFRTAAISGAALLSDLNHTVLQKDLGVAAYHVGKMMRDIERLRKLANPPLSVTTRVTDVLFMDDFLTSEKILELQESINDEQSMREALELETEKLKSEKERLMDEISSLEEMEHLLNEQLENATKGGPNDDNVSEKSNNNNKNNNNNNAKLSDDPNKNNNNNNNNNGQASNQDDNKSSDVLPANVVQSNEELQKLRNEIRRMTDEKIALVQATAQEMDTLRKIIRVLSIEYEAISGTPLGKVAPYATVDGLLGVLGLERSKR